MRVITKAFGQVEVDEQQKVVFPSGLFGFEEFQDYVILDADQQPFFYLQSVDSEQVAFILINPFLFRPDYEMNIDNEDVSFIGINDPAKALIFSIVTIPSDGSPMTANLQGPIIINRENHQGIQAILTDSRWKTKHDIVAELATAKTAGN